MGFFKNINIDIEERQARSKVQIGDVGKTTFTKTDFTDHIISKHESFHITPEDIIKISTDINKLPIFSDYGICFDSYVSDQTDEIPYGTYILRTNYNKRVEKYERFYKVEKVVNHPDAGHLKRPDTIIRHACRDCAFYGRCRNAPDCHIKNININNDPSTLIDTVYFKFDEKNDKMISSTTTPREDVRTTYINRDEWLKSFNQ